MEKQNQIQQHSQEKGLLTKLAVAIKGKNELDISLIDKMELNIELKKFKNKNGSINFPMIFDIPKADRIAAMASKDLSNTIQYITVALTLAFEAMNLSRPMTSSQVVDLAEVIVDEAESDNLAFEDLMLFLQKLTRGEFGENYEGMDIPKFMTRFNKYRDERWGEAVSIRDERELSYKNMGVVERSCQPDPIADSLSNFASRMADMKDKLKQKTEEVKSLRGDR